MTTETKISGFRTSFYIPSIKKVDFHLPHLRIIGTNYCGEMQRTAFKWRELCLDVLCRRDYAEKAVARFSNQIQSEYYGENISVSIEGIFCLHVYNPFHNQQVFHLVVLIEKLDNQYRHKF